MSNIIQNEYAFPLTVASYDVGADDRLRLSAILRYQQEAGERHLAPGGMGWNALMTHGIAFVASRWRTRIHRLPHMGESVTLTTWHRERKGPRFFRCYEWRDAQGALLIEGVMQFALVSVAEHRLLRGTEFDVFGVQDQPHRTVSCGDPSRWSLPAMAAGDTYTVRRSDIDRNGHLNNTRYADLLTDVLPTDAVAELELQFAGECRLGDTLTLATGADDALYVSGTTERGVAFAARVMTDGV